MLIGVFEKVSYKNFKNNIIMGIKAKNIKRQNKNQYVNFLFLHLI
jgi:hypothetical protein